MDCSGSLSAGVLCVGERGESRGTEISRVDDRRAEQKGLRAGQEEPRREATWNQALESHPTSRLADEGPVVCEASVPSRGGFTELKTTSDGAVSLQDDTSPF